MKSNKLKQLNDARKMVAQLEQEIQRERAQKLKNAHLDYGFEDRQELIKALQTMGRNSSSRGSAATAPAKKRGRKKRGRAKITPEIKQRVKALAGEGKTGAAIAREVGISLPSVQNIKKELGLVRARK